MTTLMQVNAQWSSRPADQRFTSLFDLHDRVLAAKENSVAGTVSSRKLKVIPHPMDEQRGLAVEGANGLYVPTHWSFSQLAGLAGAPAGYLRKLPSPIAAAALNYGLRFDRDAQDVGVLRTKTSVETVDGIADGNDPIEFLELRAATGPNYGRIWNADITKELTDRFGDGLSGRFRVPGEFGKAVPITKQNTTIYGSDRDMFVFLADETNRIEMDNRRNGEKGSLARGFFVWNSEVGSATMGIAMFLFDYVCKNRIVWGVKEFKEVRLRHTAKAPDRWMEEVSPVIEAYAESSAKPVEDTIRLAQEKKLNTDLNDFLKGLKFNETEMTAIKAAHLREEDRPIETLWDVTTAVTAHAKTIKNQDDRVAMERRGGAVLDLAAEF